ncbi:hypothetical protein PBRA_008169 [Plasmodiophora brassicae]|nr:hypothetical protein PBRA_008169 [Plasmodiophora brassicae]
MESLCNAPMRPSAVDLHDALVGHDSLAPIRDALLSSSSSSSSGSGGPALEHLPLLAAHLEGSPDPLQHHVDAFLAMSNGGWAPDAVRDAIVKVADRKAHGCKKGGADVDVHASTDARYRWRWEVAQLDHIPGGLRPWVKRERGIDAAIRRVVQACEAAVRLGAAKRRDGLHTKLLRAMDALAKAQNDVEARIAQNASERADEIRRSIKKASVSQRKKAAEESVKNVEKSRSFMEAFLVRSSPAKARPQDERSGGGQVGMFMPFYLKEHTTLAPQRGSARTTDAPLRFNVQADVALHVAGRRRRRRHRPPVSTRKRLLQFHTDVRPPFVGRLARTSTVVGGRRPFARDPSLDYTVDSDDEWEQDDVEDADVITDDDDGVLSDDSDDRDVELRRDGLEDDGWLEPEGDVGDAGEPSAPAPAHDVNLRIIGPVQDVTLLAEPDREALGAFRRIVCADVVERLAAAASTTVPTPKKITKFFSSKARAVAV